MQATLRKAQPDQSNLTAIEKGSRSEPHYRSHYRLPLAALGFPYRLPAPIN